MIDKVEFTAKNLTSNAGVLLLLNYTEEQRIFQELDEMLVFDNKSTDSNKDEPLENFDLWRFSRCRQAGKVSFVKSRAVNVEGNQEGAVKGYHPGHQGNNCYNILMAFCD